MIKSSEYNKIENNIKQFKTMLDEILKILGDLEESLDYVNREIKSLKYSLTCFKTNLKQLKLRKKYGDNHTAFEWEEIFDNIYTTKNDIRERKRRKKKYSSQRKSIIRKLSKRLK